MSGTRSVCLSLWKVDDTATSLLMQRFYANLLGRREGLVRPMTKADALREAKAWLRGLTKIPAKDEGKQIARGAPRAREGDPVLDHPFAHPRFWAAFILAGDPG